MKRRVSNNSTGGRWGWIAGLALVAGALAPWSAGAVSRGDECSIVFEIEARSNSKVSAKASAEGVADLLSQGEIGSVEKVLPGRSHPSLVRVNLGNESVLAVMKDRGSEKGRRKEELAYRLDQVLGFGLVPLTVLRVLPDGRVVSLQLFVEGQAAEWNHDIRLFTALTGNIDRGGEQNVIADASGRQYAIDNEGIFMNRGPELTFFDKIALAQIEPSQHAIERLKLLASGQLTKPLLRLLPEQEVHDFVERARAIAQRLKLRIDE